MEEVVEVVVGVGIGIGIVLPPILLLLRRGVRGNSHNTRKGLSISLISE